MKFKVFRFCFEIKNNEKNSCKFTGKIPEVLSTLKAGTQYLNITLLFIQICRVLVILYNTGLPLGLEECEGIFQSVKSRGILDKCYLLFLSDI